MSKTPPYVYRFTNTFDGKVYIGSSERLRRREDHEFLLNRGSHDNSHFQRAFDKYGATSFKFEVVEKNIPVEERYEREQFWIDKHQAANQEFGYNICKKAAPGFSGNHSEETKRVLSEQRLGVPKSLETRSKMSVSMTGTKKPEGFGAGVAERVRQFYIDHPEERLKRAEEARLGTHNKGKKLGPQPSMSKAAKEGAKRPERHAQLVAASKKAAENRAKERSMRGPPEPKVPKKRGPKKGTPRPTLRKLTFDEAQQVRKLHAEGSSYAALAIEFGTNRVVIANIVKNKILSS